MNGFERHPYIPNSVPEVQQEMLQELGMSSLEELHKNVPELLKLKNEMDLPPAFESEYALRRHVEGLLGKDTSCKKNLNFLGAGCWQHYVPAICDEINGKGEFLTAYGGEPYNDEGRFQALFEYESMVAELVDMEKERQRLAKEKARLEQEIARSQGKLNNPGFVGKAPAAVVQKEQENLARNQEKLAQLDAQMKAMG